MTGTPRRAIGSIPDGAATVRHHLIAARFAAFRRAHAAWREAPNA